VRRELEHLPDNKGKLKQPPKFTYAELPPLDNHSKSRFRLSWTSEAEEDLEDTLVEVEDVFVETWPGHFDDAIDCSQLLEHSPGPKPGHVTPPLSSSDNSKDGKGPDSASPSKNKSPGSKTTAKRPLGDGDKAEKSSPDKKSKTGH